MYCSQCGRSNPDHARFCMYCGTEFVEMTPEPQVKPATGPTRRLDEAPAGTSEYRPIVQPTRPRSGTATANGKRVTQPNAAFWLIGVAMLFLTNTFWPGILVLVGLSSYLHESNHGQHDKGWRNLLFFGLLALLFWSNWFWPGILIVAGLMMLLSPKLRRCTS
jgi:hypothetical protein